jgi:uncharacterized membrane protein
MLFLTIKLIHILLAITAVGANFTYGVWFARANREPAFAPTALRTIKFIDDRIANPAYVLLLPTGALMVWMAGLSFATFWIAAAMGLWTVAIVVAYAVYSPILRKQIAAVEREGVHGTEAVKLSTRGQIVAGILGVLVLAIIVLMVFKPA